MVFPFVDAAFSQGPPIHGGVRMVEGPLAGTFGVILKKKEKKHRLVVEVELFLPL
jgi:transcription antitermination factor NusG